MEHTLPLQLVLGPGDRHPALAEVLDVSAEAHALSTEGRLSRQQARFEQLIGHFQQLTAAALAG